MSGIKPEFTCWRRTWDLCSPPRAVDKIWFFVRRSRNDVFISLKTIFRASVTQFDVKWWSSDPTGRASVSCIWRKVAKLGEADWAAALKKLFMILSPTCPRIAFRDGLCYALNSYLLEPNRFRVHPTLLSQPSAASSAMSTPFIIGQYRSIPIMS